MAAGHIEGSHQILEAMCNHRGTAVLMDRELTRNDAVAGGGKIFEAAGGRYSVAAR